MNFLSPKRKRKQQQQQQQSDDACSQSRRLVAATCNGWPTALAHLSRIGVDMNVQCTDGSGVTPLHIAAITGNNLVVKVLIRHGAEVNCRESACLSTPLHFAAIRGGVKVDVKSIIAWNREIAERGCGGVVGEMTLSPDTRHSAENYEATILTLARKGADLNARDVHGKTPLHLAVQHRSDGAVKTLLGLGAEVDAEDEVGRLPWHYALEHDDSESLRWLLAFGADVNDVNMFCGSDRDRLSAVLASGGSSMKYLVFDQLSRLRAAGLFVSSLYGAYDGESSRSYYRQCLREVEKMKSYEIEDGVYLYDLLHMSPRRRNAYTRASDRTASMLIKFEREFPNYYGIVRACFFDERKRKPLMREAKCAWYHLTNIGLPDICVEHILSNLNSCCLKIMIEGAKHCNALN